MVLIKLIALCCIGYCLDLINGYPEKLPEYLTAINKNNSACYGTHTHFKPSCPPNRVIAIQDVNVGAKRKSLNCSKEVNDFTPRNDTCCTPDITNDCISVYSYAYAGIDYTFHKNCTGNQTCKHPFPVVNDITGCDRDDVYMDITNYMYMDYACIETARIKKLCENKVYSVSSGTFYLQSDNYPDSKFYYGISTCTCHVQALTDVTGIYFYTLDVRLGDDTRDCEQSLSISDGEVYTNTTYDCSSATIFNITKSNLSQNAWITFKNTQNTTLGVTASDVYVWIGVQAKDNGPLSISCSVNYSIPPPTTTSQSPPGIRLSLIIGITVAALIFLILLIIILICCAKKDKNRKIASNESGFSSKAPTTSNSMPKNIVFSKTQTPSDKLSSILSNQRQDTDVIVNDKTSNMDDVKVTGISLPPITALTKVNEDSKLDELDENAQKVKSSEEEPKRKHRKKKRKKRKERGTQEPSDQYVLDDQVIAEQSVSNLNKQEQEGAAEDILLNQNNRKKKKRKTRKEETDKTEPTDQNDVIEDNTV